MHAPSTGLPGDTGEGPDAAREPPDVSRKGAARRVDPFDLLERYGILLVWGAVIVLFSVLRPSTFPTTVNFQTIFGTQAVLLIMTLGAGKGATVEVSGDNEADVEAIATLVEKDLDA